MSDNNLTTKNPGDVISSEDPNQYKSAFDGNIVPRDVTGVATDLAGSLGTTLLRWFRLFISKITLGDPDDEVHIEQTSATLTIKINDIVKFSLDSSGIDGTYISTATKIKTQKMVLTGSGTFDAPAGITEFVVVGSGAGGAGGGGAGRTKGGGGAGGTSAIAFAYRLTVAPLAAIVYSVAGVSVGGAGGGVAADGADGTNGGNTTFGALTFYGGTGGAKGTTLGGTGILIKLFKGLIFMGSGSGGTGPNAGTAGDDTIAFSGGAAGAGGGSESGGGGGGAASLYAAGGDGDFGNGGPGGGDGSQGSGGGGGGGGKTGGSDAGSAGGDGGPGYLAIYWIDND